MEMSTREERGYTVIATTGRVDTVTAPRFEAYCVAAIDAGARKLVLDFSQVVYISSAGLSSVLAVAKRAGHVGGTFAISGLSGMVREIFAISGFDTIVPVKADLEEALGSA
jgi:stage II sporulation protein AA (anti-sigma F factor antagonist)